MIIAIDFTGSNGNPTSPNSLHFMDPSKPNQYQTAILAIS
jgi:copine 1/2/3